MFRISTSDAIPGPVGPRFAGKVALVTGGGIGPDATGLSNVGAAICRLLAREECRVAVLDRDLESANRAADVIEQEGGDAFVVECDVSVAEDCGRAVGQVITAAGRIDVLVNSVGLHIGRDMSVADIVEEEWDLSMSVNAKGPMLMAKYAVPHMPRGGSIVNISSTIAVRWGRGGGLGYGVSKSALIGLTQALAIHEAPRGIRTNCVCPGGIWSSRRHGDEDVEAGREFRRRRSPLMLEGTAWDIAHAVAFLASDQARWITGETLIVDGGATVQRYVPEQEPARSGDAAI